MLFRSRFERLDEGSCVCAYPGAVKRHVRQEHHSVELEASSVAEVEVYPPPGPLRLNDPSHFSP